MKLYIVHAYQTRISHDCRSTSRLHTRTHLFINMGKGVEGTKLMPQLMTYKVQIKIIVFIGAIETYKRVYRIALPFLIVHTDTTNTA